MMIAVFYHIIMILGDSFLLVIFELGDEVLDVYGVDHRWGLPDNCPVFTVVMVVYHYV